MESFINETLMLRMTTWILATKKEKYVYLEIKSFCCNSPKIVSF